MELPFTHRPGRRERQLRRRHENPLFAWPPQSVEPEDLLNAQKADHEDLEAFRGGFRDVVQQAVDLPPDAGSESVLSLKERLEQHYEQSYALPADLSVERQALKRLIDLIMKALWRQAATDPIAHQELSDEEAARTIHFRLLEQPLVADLLHDQSCISPEELAATLLSSAPTEVEAACEVFDAPQLGVIGTTAQAIIMSLEEQGLDAAQAKTNLELVLRRLEQFEVGSN